MNYFMRKDKMNRIILRLDRIRPYYKVVICDDGEKETTYHLENRKRDIEINLSEQAMINLYGLDETGNRCFLERIYTKGTKLEELVKTSLAEFRHEVRKEIDYVSKQE